MPEKGMNELDMTHSLGDAKNIQITRTNWYRRNDCYPAFTAGLVLPRNLSNIAIIGANQRGRKLYWKYIKFSSVFSCNRNMKEHLKKLLSFEEHQSFLQHFLIIGFVIYTALNRTFASGIKWNNFTSKRKFLGIVLEFYMKSLLNVPSKIIYIA